MAPLRLFVERCRGEVAQCLDHRAVAVRDRRRNLAARRLVHKRHELVGEARHRAADANSADVGAASDAAHPAALGNVALDDRSPAPELDQALGRIVFRRKFALFVITGAIATLVHGVAEEPGRPARVVERNHRRASRRLPQQIEDRFREIVGLYRAAGYADDRNAGARLPVPAEIIENAHGSGRIAGHRVNAAVRRAGSDRQDSPGSGR